jgi:nucleotide-binding universal stress UspA family protein
MSDAKTTTLVVGFDYSPISELALRRAFDVASREEHAEVHVVTVILLGDSGGAGIAGVPIHPVISVDAAHEALQKKAGEVLADWQKKTGRNFARLVTHIRSEAPAAEIAQLASDLAADLVVVGTHGHRGFSRLLLGSVAEGVVRLSECEVLVVRPQKAAAKTPQIEPPCPRCVEERKRTGGEQFWCEQHRERHGQRHTYHYESRLAQDGNISGLAKKI